MVSEKVIPYHCIPLRGPVYDTAFVDSSRHDLKEKNILVGAYTRSIDNHDLLLRKRSEADRGLL